MKLLRYGLILAAASLAVGACTTARYQMLDQRGGVVAAPTNRRGNRMKALKLIKQHCPNGYEITSEGEVPIGTVSRSDISTEPNIFDGTDISQSTRFRELTEWRIQFTCK